MSAALRPSKEIRHLSCAVGLVLLAPVALAVLRIP